ncbi:ribosome biogenesis GTPase Der [Patescibacteria group bacterium]|nr:ribosome biogenesis GTPase Der [Patescibacteria group bacterium]
MSTPAKIEFDNLPIVALVGRVNVGKSTIFNKLIEEQKAIVSKIPGTTRTSNEGVVLWRGKQFKLIDTGGLAFTDSVLLKESIIEQTENAIEKADIIVLVTDGQEGILPQEKELVKLLRKQKDKKIILVANKIDNQKIENLMEQHEWSKLALGNPWIISAASSRNVGDFLDHLMTLMNKLKRRPKIVKEEKKEVININIIGKPNVGKSSLFNKLIGEEKVIVSDMAHTTREPHDTLVSYKKQLINFVDTAGIRRKAKVAGSLEKIGIGKSIKSVDDSDIVLFMLDGKESISSQDRQLGGFLERRSKSVIILVNKWDLTDDNDEAHQKKVRQMVFAHFPHLKFAPMMFVSGKTGLNVHKIFPMIEKVWRARHTEIPEEALESFLSHSLKVKLPSRGKGTRHPSLLGLRQLNAAPPIFELFVKYRTSVHSSYVHYLENRLREQFDFLGTPIVIKLTKTKR